MAEMMTMACAMGGSSVRETWITGSQPGGTSRARCAAAEHLSRLVPPGWDPVIHVSLTDDPPMAQAIVIISAIASGTARA